MSSAPEMSITLSQRADFQFDLSFDPAREVILCDEPPPLGLGMGPSPVHLLAAAVGNCLADSLLFALRKFRQQPEPLRCEVSAEVGRNAQGRVRVLHLRAVLTLGVPATTLEHLDRVLASFEDYCTVSQSVGQGVPIDIAVCDSTGQVLKGAR